MADDERFLRECLAYLAAPLPDEPSANALGGEAAAGASSSLLNALLEPEELSSSPHTPASTSTTGTTTTAQQQPHTARNGTTAASRNSTREKMQRELRELRAQHTALQHALSALQQQRQQQQQQRTQQQQQRTQQRTQQQSPSQQLLLASWKRIARRQREQRQRAETENARLKQKVESSLGIARAFQQSIWDWMASESLTSDQAHPHYYAPSSHQIALKSTAFADPRDVQIYAMLATQLDGAVLMMDHVFRENGLGRWQVGSPPSRVQMKTRHQSPVTMFNVAPLPSSGTTDSDTDESMYIEFVNADVLPFPRRVVSNASWRCWEQRSLAKNCVVYANLKDAKDTFASKSCCEIYLSEDSSASSSISMEFLSVTRGIRYDDRVVYVWRGITKSDAHFPGAYVDETGWQVVRALSSASDGDGAFEDGSVILTCTQLEPKCSEALDELQTRSVAPLANLVLSAYKVDMQEVSDLMMDLMLQEAATAS